MSPRKSPPIHRKTQVFSGGGIWFNFPNGTNDLGAQMLFPLELFGEYHSSRGFQPGPSEKSVIIKTPGTSLSDQILAFLKLDKLFSLLG